MEKIRKLNKILIIILDGLVISLPFLFSLRIIESVMLKEYFEVLFFTLIYVLYIIAISNLNIGKFNKTKKEKETKENKIKTLDEEFKLEKPKGRHD